MGETFDLMLTNKLNETGVAEALPANFNKARFVRNCVAFLNANSDNLKDIKQENILFEILKASYLDLDFSAKDCYLVPYGKKVQYQTSYTGEMKLCRKYSTRPIKDIYAKLIREGDEFEECIIGGEQTINFKPKFLNDGNIIGAFAVVVFTDGGMIYDVMSMKELENTRSCSKAKNSPAWSKFPGEMYKKTVLRRLCKTITLDFENATQRATFDDDMAIETDPQKLNEIHVENEANSVDFEPFDVEGVEV